MIMRPITGDLSRAFLVPWIVTALLLVGASSRTFAGDPADQTSLRVLLEPEGPAYLKQHLRLKMTFTNLGKTTMNIDSEAVGSWTFSIRDDRGNPPVGVDNPEPLITEPVLLEGYSDRVLSVDLSAWFPRVTRKRRTWTIEWAHGDLSADPVKVRVIRAYDPERDKYAIVKTELGTMTWVLLPGVAPDHVKHFVDMVREGFYDGLSFYRYIPGLQVEGGDPHEDGTGGWRHLLMGEISADLSVSAGMIGASRKVTSMTSDSMFFITLGSFNFMKGKHTFFARIDQGWDVIGAMAHRNNSGKTGLGIPYLLKPPVRIERVKISR